MNFEDTIRLLNQVNMAAYGVAPFAEKLKVEHDEETRHYEVVWKDGKPMTKVSDNILLK